VAINTPALDPTATPPQGPPDGPLALRGKPLIALTQDPGLLATLKRVTDPAHKVCVACSEIDFSTALMAHHAGVAVLDCAAIATPIAQLTSRLRTQFPELVLIVAGGIDEQGMLAAQIADGSVHRFLHKPVSEQRVRLFVEAAWRRHQDDRALPYAAAAAPRGARRAAKWWLALCLLAAIAVPLAWFGQPATQPAPAPAPAPGAAASGDSALEKLLSRADEALAAGALTTPPGANAAELYREAMRRNARDPRAVNGLEQVIEKLLAAAESQLQANNLEQAQRLAGEARAINPDHPRVAFLGAQIGAQRERAVLGKAQRAAASGNLAGALAVLDDAARGGHRSTLATEAREELAQKQADGRVSDFLSRARDAADHGRLLQPAQDNARFYVESAAALAPADPAVQEATQELGARLLAEGRQALGEKNPDAADGWAAAAADAGANAADLAALRAGAQQLRGAARADSFAHLALAFNERLVAGKLLEPASDSAKSYLAQLLQAEPANPATQQARTTYIARVLEQERGALQVQDYAAAELWLGEARAAGADGAALAAADTALNAAREQAQQTSNDVPASSLTRTRYVAPSFPLAARQRSLEGWVDVRFVVRSDGSVGDAAIMGAEPVGIFEQAALEAVHRWRYRPIVRDGQAVSQTTRVRVRFAMQP
jgi:protein TonB